MAQLKILSGGRVGIGTNDVSAYKLHVVGDNYLQALRITSSASAWGYASRVQTANGYVKCFAGGTANLADNFFILANGVLWSQGQVYFSDVNLKTNIETITNPLNKINQLRGVYFNYKQSEQMDSSLGVSFSNNKRRIGLIAQEVASIIPEVVDTTDKNLLGVNYANLVALLIEGMKAQQTQINNLQTIISACCPNSTSTVSGSDTITGIDTSIIDMNGAQPNDRSSLGKTSSTKLQDNSKVIKYNSSLYQNKPNPFSQSTTIEYYVPEKAENVSILIFDMQGSLIKSIKNLGIGKGSVMINAAELRAGMYLYSLIVNGNEIDTKKMILLD
jgi:hypothetical protein